MSDPVQAVVRPTGLELGIRTGFALPFGNSDATHSYAPLQGGGAPSGLGPSDPLNTDIANTVPIWFDAGYRVIPNLYLGGYFAYGLGSVPDNAQSYCRGIACTLHDLRLGVDVQVHALPMGRFDPWGGLGAGFEWLQASWDHPSRGSPALGGLATGDLDGGSQLSGWEFVNVQAGVDYRPDGRWGVGPFVMLSFAQFGTFSTSWYSNPVEQKAIHEWLLLGIRGIFDTGSRTFAAPSPTLRWTQ